MRLCENNSPSPSNTFPSPARCVITPQEARDRRGRLDKLPHSADIEAERPNDGYDEDSYNHNPPFQDKLNWMNLISKGISPVSSPPEAGAVDETPAIVDFNTPSNALFLYLSNVGNDRTLRCNLLTFLKYLVTTTAKSFHVLEPSAKYLFFFILFYLTSLFWFHD